MAVTHLVCVFEGAPGPVQGAAKAGIAVASNTTPSSAGASAPERHASNLSFLDMNSSVSGIFDLGRRLAHPSICPGRPRQGTLFLVLLVLRRYDEPRMTSCVFCA